MDHAGQGSASAPDTPFARLRARLDAREEGEGPPGPVERALAGLAARLGPLARVPFPVWVFSALFLGIGAGFLLPGLVFLGNGVLAGFGYLADAAPIIIFFTLTPALVGMYATARAGKFALYVMVGFVFTTVVGGLFALLVSLIFFPGVGLGFGVEGLGEQLWDIIVLSWGLFGSSPLFRAIWGAVLFSLLLFVGGAYWRSEAPGNPVGRMFRTVMDIYVLVGVHAVAALGRVIKYLMPLVLFLVGISLVTALPARLAQATAEVQGLQDPPWTMLEAYFVSIGVLVVITFLWLGLASLALTAYTRFPLRRLVSQYLLIVYPFAWATSSSAASIPINITSSRDGLGVRPEVRNFIIPVGATVNLDGTMMAAVVGTIVAAKMVGYEVSVADFLLAMIPLVLITIGTPGVPGGLALLAGPVMAAVLPLPPGTEALFALVFFALLVGVNDMFRTAVNVCDNGLLALLLDKWWPERFALGDDVNPFLPVGEAGAPGGQAPRGDETASAVISAERDAR